MCESNILRSKVHTILFVLCPPSVVGLLSTKIVYKADVRPRLFIILGENSLGVSSVS